MTDMKVGRMGQSQNGWPVLSPAETFLWELPTGTGVHFRLAGGPPGFVLCHFATWFGECVERIQGDTWDDWGYAVRPIRGGSSVVSNHASGTALDINAQAHPLSRRNTFTDDQEWRLVQRLRGRYGGIIRWGGTYERRADEMHFELVGDRAAVRALAGLLAHTDRGRRVKARNPGATHR